MSRDAASIRPATLADLTALRLLWQALVAEQLALAPIPLGPGDELRWTSDMAMRLEKQSTGDPAIYIRVLEDPNDPDPILGFCSGAVEERGLGEPKRYWLAHHLYLRPDVRGQGLGRLLIEDGLAYADAQDLPVIELVAFAGDTAWARRGWLPLTTRYTISVSQARIRYATLSEKAS